MNQNSKPEIDWWSMSLTGNPALDGLVGLAAGVILVLSVCAVAFWWECRR